MSKYKKIDLWGEIYPDLPKKVTLRPFALESGENFPAVLVLPGGGYGFCSEQEGDPVACWLNSLGISAFVLDYSVEPSKHPQPLNDARRAMQYLRANASKYNIDSNRVGVIGFSAGGHLAASLSNFHNEKNLDVNDDLEAINARPDLCILSYPVISWGEFAHEGSRENLLGMKPDAELLHKTSMENSVSTDTPSTFIWHTAEDEPVPVENAYLYAMALQRKKVPCELHVYPFGEHGMGLGTIDFRRNSHYGQWRHSCERWLSLMGF